MKDDKKLVDYFDLNEAWDNAIIDIGVGSFTDCVKSSSKLLGKTVFNTGLFLGETGVEIIKGLPDYAINQAERKLSDDKNLTSEDRDKLEGGFKVEVQKVQHDAA